MNLTHTHIQTVTKIGGCCRTRCTHGSYLVHAVTHNIAGRTIITQLESHVKAGGMYKPYEPTANLIFIGPRYLGVVSDDKVVLGNKELK